MTTWNPMNKTTVSRNSKKTSGDSKQEADVLDAFIHKIVLPNLDPASRMKKPDL